MRDTMMNKQGPGKIDWCTHTWNPISGCKHNCSYCYLHRLEKIGRFNMIPQIHDDRLEDPGKIKKPSTIFVGSSGDMFGDWIEAQYIQKVIDVTKKYIQHNYLFLTKNPKRYYDFVFPMNCWLGTTVDTNDRFNKVKELNFPSTLHNKYFISFEPLLEEPNFKLVDVPVEWIIIGADSNQGAARPPLRWAKNLIDQAYGLGVAVWVKDNYEYPETIKHKPQ